jgi:allantoate deiminase
MDARLDPMIAVAQMVLEVTRLAKELGPPAVATVGRVVAEPGSPNIVAAEVRFTIDARYPDAGKHEQLMAHIGEACRAIAAARGLGVHMDRLTFQPPTVSSPDLVRVISEAAGDLGLPHLMMVSGAGHDTQVLARRGMRRAMLFVPSRDGRSHSPDEFTAIEDIVAGIAVLTEVLYRLAY